MLQDQYRALMQYSIPKDCHVDKPPAKNTQDWHCVKVNLLIKFYYSSNGTLMLSVRYSVEHIISRDAKHVSSVLLPEQRAKKVERVAMKLVLILQIPFFFAVWTY